MNLSLFSQYHRFSEGQHLEHELKKVVAPSKSIEIINFPNGMTGNEIKDFVLSEAGVEAKSHMTVAFFRKRKVRRTVHISFEDVGSAVLALARSSWKLKTAEFTIGMRTSFSVGEKEFRQDVERSNGRHRLIGDDLDHDRLVESEGFEPKTRKRGGSADVKGGGGDDADVQDCDKTEDGEEIIEKCEAFEANAVTQDEGAVDSTVEAKDGVEPSESSQV